MSEMQLQKNEARSETLESPRFEDGKPMLLAGLRDHYTRATMKEIPGLWQRFGSYLGRIPGQVSGVAYGVCFPSTDGFDYLSGVEVLDSSGLPRDLSVVTMPEQRYAVFAHRSHVLNLHETCRAIEHEWLPKSRYSFALGTAGAPGFFERYGECFDPGLGIGDVEVWVPIR